MLVLILSITVFFRVSIKNIKSKALVKNILRLKEFKV